MKKQAIDWEKYLRKTYLRFNRKTKDLESSPKKIYRWQISIWKDAQHHSSLGNCKLKQQWKATTHLSEWLKSKTLITPNAEQDVKQQELSFFCWWECKMVQPLWKTVWQFLAKLNILLPYDPAIKLLGIYSN